MTQKFKAPELLVCEKCKGEVSGETMTEKRYICPHCGAYNKMPARLRIESVSDRDSFREFWHGAATNDPLKFPNYAEKLKKSRGASGEDEGVLCGVARIGGEETCIFAMEPKFMMGSMGAAVGEKSLGLAAQVRALAAETADGYRVLRGYRGLFALLWCGFVFTLVFSPISALFPLMTLDHFSGTTGDAATAEIVFSVGMIAGSALLTATGGFRNRAYTVCFATALYGFATLVAGCAGPNAGGMQLFFVMSFLMGLSSPFYSGPQTALMQEKVSPEYLGRVFGLYGAIMSWAMPLGLAFSSLFADAVGAPAWFFGAGVAMVILACVTWAIPAIRNVER